MQSRLSLRCLGEPVLSGPDGEPIRFKVSKHLALLVFLAVEAKSRHHRDHLAELLWANLPDGDNRHSLATALSMIRSVAGQECLETDRDHVRFNRSQLDLDLDRLETGDVLASELQPALDIAGFLDGLEVPGASEFMLWRERQRSRWLPLVREALLKRIDKCRRTGDFKQIEHLGDRMLRLDELSEEAVRAKMEARAFAGDRLGALKVFEAWRERLLEDLGASPSALVEGMAIRLRRRGIDRPAASRIEAVPTHQWKDRPFVGRANEYQALYEGWERTQRGLPGHAILIGDSGIGKSTLADRLATAAGLEGAVTARVQCYDVEREIPYAAVAGFVQALLSQPGASGTTPEALAELARVVPEVRQKYPTIPDAVESQGETARILLTEAFQQLLLTLAEEQPVILLLDDFHLADDASLAVLHLMMRRSQGQPVMVLFATRLDAPEPSPQASRLRESAERLGITAIELSPMNEAESAELLASFISEDEPQPTAATARALLRAAAGYPMVLELVVQDWKANGERAVALSVDAMTADPAVAGAVKGAYHQLLDRLTASLDPATRNVLTMAALLGGRLNNLPSYALADLGRGQTMSGMAALVRLRILRERGDRLEFANELIRTHVYMTMPSPLRRQLHAEVAGQLLAEAADGSMRSGLEIAWHCIRGGRRDEGIPYLLSGAREALEDGAPHEVERALQTALPELASRDAATAKLLLAESMQEQARWLDSLNMLYELAGQEGVDTAIVEILSFWARLRLLDIAEDNCQGVLLRLRSIIETSTSPSVAARALAVAAYLLYDNRNRKASREFLALSDSVPKELVGEANLRMVISRALLANQVGGRGPAYDDLLRVSRDLRSTKLASVAAIQVLQGSASLHCGRGEYEAAVADAMTAHAMAARLGNDAAMGSAASNLAICYGRLGDYQAQISWGEKGLHQIGSRFTGFRDIQLSFARAFGNAMLGNTDAALSALSEANARIPHTAPRWMIQAWHFQQADVLHVAGRKRDAIGRAKIALAEDDLHSDSLAGPFARWVTLCGVASGELAPARARLKRLRAKLDIYDAVDQVEILASGCLLERALGQPTNAARLQADQEKLRSRLVDLPYATTTQLVRLSIIERAR